MKPISIAFIESILLTEAKIVEKGEGNSKQNAIFFFMFLEGRKRKNKERKRREKRRKEEKKGRKEEKTERKRKKERRKRKRRRKKRGGRTKRRSVVGTIFVFSF